VAGCDDVEDEEEGLNATTIEHSINNIDTNAVLTRIKNNSLFRLIMFECMINGVNNKVDDLLYKLFHFEELCECRCVDES
jgi:hypothetical protein